MLSIDAADPIGCSLFLWEDEGEDRNREMERSTNLCGCCLLLSVQRELGTDLPLDYTDENSWVHLFMQ